MKPEDLEKAVKRLEQIVSSHDLVLTIVSSQIDAVIQELAEALRRQGIDPQPFIKRVKQRANEATRVELRKKEKLREQSRKLREEDEST